MPVARDAYRSFFHFARSPSPRVNCPDIINAVDFSASGDQRARISAGRSIENRGPARSTADAVREYAWGDRVRGCDKSSFRGRVWNLAFPSENSVYPPGGFRLRSAGFGISEMRCRARGMFITKFYYPPGKLPRLYVTLRDVPYYYTTREQCVSPPYAATLRSALSSFHYVHAYSPESSTPW